jgi:type IV secretory pathway VirB4 component
MIINTDVVLGATGLAAIGSAVLAPELLNLRREASLSRESLSQRVLGPFGLVPAKQRVSRVLPWKCAIRPNVIKLRNGSYMAAWRIAASDVGTLLDSEILDTAYGFAATIGAQSPSTKIQLYERRAPWAEYEKGLGWDHPIARLLDDKIVPQLFERERVYHTERTLVVTSAPTSESLDALRAAVSVGVDAQRRTENDLLSEFDSLGEALEAGLNTRTLSVERLGERTVTDATGTERTVSDLISFCNLCVTGFNTPIVPPPAGVDLHDYLAVELDRGGYEPCIAQLEVSAIIPMPFPPEAVPMMLDKLTQLKVSHMLYVSFVPDTVAEAHRKLTASASNFKAQANFMAKRHVDPAFAAGHEQMVDAIGKTRSEYTRYGRAYYAIIVRARSRSDVRKAERIVQSALADCHFRGSVRRWGALSTIFSILPGQSAIAEKRQVPMDALTIAKAFPIHSATKGRKHSEAESFKGIPVPPITYALGPGGEFFRHHLNVKDVFHSVKFGRPGVGKSVDEVFEDAMWLARIPFGGVTVIDRGPSAYQLCMMLDGLYYRVLGRNSPGFALFADAHIPSQAREIYAIVKRMVELSGVPVTGLRERWIKEAIADVGGRPRADRCMSGFLEHLQDPDESLHPVLKKYTRLGDMGGTFDGVTDTFETGRYNVIDLELVMNLAPELLIPLLECVIWKTRTAVRRMKEAMGADGELVHWRIRVDECNTNLMRHPIGVQFLVDMALMGRKENFALALATNSIRKFAECAGSSDVMFATATRVYFNDPAATGENRQYYEDHELPERGILQLPELGDHEFLLHQPEANICRRLSHRLDKNVLAVIGTSRNVTMVDHYIDRFPAARDGDHRWKKELLKAYGAEEAAEWLAALIESAPDALEVVS